MKRKQQLEIDDFQKWRMEAEMLYASDGEGKKMMVSIFGAIRIYKDGQLVHEGIHPNDAIDKYNSI